MTVKVLSANLVLSTDAGTVEWGSPTERSVDEFVEMLTKLAKSLNADLKVHVHHEQAYRVIILAPTVRDGNARAAELFKAAIHTVAIITPASTGRSVGVIADVIDTHPDLADSPYFDALIAAAQPCLATTTRERQYAALAAIEAADGKHLDQEDVR